MKRLLLVVLLLVVTGPLFAQAVTRKSELLNSKHDFRAGSTAAIRATSENDACIFCHTPHNANPGELLWNHSLSGQQFPAYSSSTLQSAVGPMGAGDASKLCLSCHDGTIALGDTVNDGILDFVQGPGYSLPPHLLSNLVTSQGYSDDHPFAFVPSLGAEIQNPAGADAVGLDASGRVQCITCHEPHEERRDPVVGKFLVKQNRASALCLTCHMKAGWAGSSHRSPADPAANLRYTSAQGAHTGYIGVTENGCESCHRPHTPQVAQRLTKFQEENTCYACHDGSVAQPRRNIRAEVQNKLYVHPVGLTPSVHDAAESPSSAATPLPETGAGGPRHAECADCHNAHASNGLATQPPMVSGALTGVSGHSSAGTFLPQSGNEYELCFKCHADSANRPQLFDSSPMGIGYGRNPQRQFDQGNPNAYDTRMEFSFSASFHPVTRPRNLSPGFGGEVPSLRAAPITPGGSPMPGRSLSAASYIYCSDCHNNDTGRNLGILSGPAGPHGSNLPHLLERSNQLEPPPATPGGHAPGIGYALAEYSLCDKCHDVQGSILQDVSFKEHRMHIRGENTACSTCHDPHASQSPMLINFDRAIVSPNDQGLLEYRRTGFRQGTCSLRCHGEDHSNEDY